MIDLVELAGRQHDKSVARTVAVLNQPNEILESIFYPFEADLDHELRLMERHVERKWWHLW